jgi:ribosomal protein S18 acetylase RimI-like enzyme
VGEPHVESYHAGGARSWASIARRIRQIERNCFGTGAFSADELRRAFNGRRHLAVLLWDGGTLIGYTQAGPSREPATYYIANTAIAKSHQGRGLVKLLMDRLYADVRAAGRRFIERDVATANGYADTVVRVHAADILATRDHDSEYGPQRFIRMRVPRQTPA